MPLMSPADFLPCAGALVLGYLLVERIQQLLNELQQPCGVLFLCDLDGDFAPGLQFVIVVTVGHVGHLTLKADLSRPIRYISCEQNQNGMQCLPRAAPAGGGGKLALRVVSSGPDQPAGDPSGIIPCPMRVSPDFHNCRTAVKGQPPAPACQNHENPRPACLL